MFETLTEQNIISYAMKNYDNPNCMGIEEFNEDMDRIKYLKRLFRKYKDSGDLKERLILNHLIVMYNVFTPEACTRMLVFKLNEFIVYLKPFLVYLSYWPEDQIGPIGENFEVIKSSEVGMDPKIIETLRSI